ncbi:amidohydrolase [Nocardia sp. NPDC003979]
MNEIVPACSPESVQRGHIVLSGLDGLLPRLLSMYQDLHRNPELSGQEVRTSALVADRLEDLGYKIETGIGGTGVVAVLPNGAGPRVLLRAELDALPVREETGLPYASTALSTDGLGNVVPVMHACGHDVHIAALIGAAALLARARSTWRGTLMVIAQPAEETLSGARAMLADGLYERFGRPDVALAQHVAPFSTGTIHHRCGELFAAAELLTVRLFGVGGHGGMPHTTIDPIPMAANVVSRLQSVIAREVDPSKSAVITVGSLHAGTAGNIIADEARLEISTRASDNDLQTDLRHAVERIVHSEAVSARAPAVPEVISLSKGPVLVNDPSLTQSILATHRSYFGDDVVSVLPGLMPASEDFGLFGLPQTGQQLPTVMWLVGAMDITESLSDSNRPSVATNTNHSQFFSPNLIPTLRACTEALILGVLTVMPGDS